jgi:hypothetical protein
MAECGWPYRQGKGFASLALQVQEFGVNRNLESIGENIRRCVCLGILGCGDGESAVYD